MIVQDDVHEFDIEEVEVDSEERSNFYITYYMVIT